MSHEHSYNRYHNDRQNVWIISEGRYADIDLRAIDEGIDSGPVKEFQISDIAYYLLNPKPIEIKKRLMGCEVFYKQGAIKKFKRKVSRLMHRLNSYKDIHSDVIVSRFRLNIPPLKDSDLESYLFKIYDSLKVYDTLSKRLNQLDPRKISEIVGICEDVGGNYSYLKLQGSNAEKIKYLQNYNSKNVGVVINKAYSTDGLFELRGFDFMAYSSNRSHRLISYLRNGKQKACVLSSNDRVVFRIEDQQLLTYIHLLQQSLNANPQMVEAFNQCIQNEAKPIKLFFNKDLEIDYSKAQLPRVYNELFEYHKLGFNQKNLIKPMLNYLQIGVSFNYIPVSDTGEDRLCTHISVLHDFRALEPLKKNLPQVYSEMSKKAFATDSGRYYLLDSIRGYSNA